MAPPRSCRRRPKWGRACVRRSPSSSPRSWMRTGPWCGWSPRRGRSSGGPWAPATPCRSRAGPRAFRCGASRCGRPAPLRGTGWFGRRRRAGALRRRASPRMRAWCTTPMVAAPPTGSSPSKRRSSAPRATRRGSRAPSTVSWAPRCRATISWRRSRARRPLAWTSASPACSARVRWPAPCSAGAWAPWRMRPPAPSPACATCWCSRTSWRWWPIRGGRRSGRWRR